MAGALESAERAKTLVQRPLAFLRHQPLPPVAVDVGALVQGMAGLIAAIRQDRAPRDGTIVFLHTGGLPALLTPRYTDWVAEWP